MVANRSLGALNDNRVMIPADANESITDLKNILRSLINGQLLLVDAPTPAATKPEDEGSE